MGNLWRNPRLFPIAFTGSDVSGKSTILELVRSNLESTDLFRTAIAVEGATHLMTAGFHPVNDRYRKGPLVFQEGLWDLINFQEELNARMLLELDTDKLLVSLSDRALLDKAAYIGRQATEEIARSRRMQILVVRERYRMVIHLVTTADGAEQVYLASQRNNPHRIMRTPAEARALDQLTREAWHGHPHHVIIDNSTDWNGKVQRVIQSLRRVLPMPEAIEQERKFVVVSGSPPPNAVRVQIIQDYLMSREEGLERRIRETTDGDGYVYTYTEKRPTAKSDERKEKEEQVSKERYDELRRERDPETLTIVKDRFRFSYDGRSFEFDRFHGELNPLAVIELENCPMDVIVKFPPGIIAVEVTGNKGFSNKALAKGKFDRKRWREIMGTAA